MANSGLAGALKVAAQKGYIEKDIKKSVNVDQKHKERIRNCVFIKLFFISESIVIQSLSLCLNIFLVFNCIRFKKMILVLIFRHWNGHVCIFIFFYYLLENQTSALSYSIEDKNRVDHLDKYAADKYRKDRREKTSNLVAFCEKTDYKPLVQVRFFIFLVKV